MATTNRELLDKGGILKSTVQLTPQQQAAIDSLSRAEIKAIIAIKDKLSGAFAAELTAGGAPKGIIQHHH
jgi:hypothetical protein